MARKFVKENVQGFSHFIHKYSVIPLAVGVVIGTAVNDLVKTIVDGLISPLIALLSPDTALQGFEVTVGSSVFKVGAVINGVVSFLVVCAVVYVFAKFVLRNQALIDDEKK